MATRARLVLFLALAAGARAALVCSLSGGCFERILAETSHGAHANLKSNATGAQPIKGIFDPLTGQWVAVTTTTLPSAWNGTTPSGPGAITAPAAIMWSSVVLALLAGAFFAKHLKGFEEAEPPYDKYLAEFLGTYMLVFSIGCNTIAGNKTWGPISIASTLMVMLYALGRVSDVNFNPAVSLALALSDRLSGARAIIYMCIQFAAGLSAAITYGLLFGETFNLAPAAGHSWWQAGVVELLYTCFLCFVVLNVATLKTQGLNEYYALAISFVIIAAGYGAGGVSLAVLNPAVAFAIDASSSALGPGWFAVYFVFEMFGAALAAVLFRVCRPEEFGTQLPSSEKSPEATSASAEAEPFPLNANLHIINKGSRRILYAQKDASGKQGFGAKSLTSGVHHAAVWHVVKLRDGFKIINQQSKRCLYARKDHNGDEEIGAVTPSKDTDDELWDIIKDGDGFRIINQHSLRSLYAKEGEDWQQGVGASVSSETPSGSNIVWLIQPEDGDGSGASTPDMSNLIVHLVSEFLGTYMLVLTIGLNVLNHSKAGAYSIAASLTSMIFALGSCSGAHFNPAVTLAILLSGRKKISGPKALYYMGAQVFGAVCAAVTYTIVMNGKTVPLSPAAGASTKALIGELAFTFLLCFVVLAVATSEKRLVEYFGFAIGACVIAGGFAIGSISGGILNPAASFGLAFTDWFNGGPIEHLFSYAAVQLLGGAAASMLFFSTHAATDFAPVVAFA